MGWEVRRGKRYYYEKLRDPKTGRVRSIYRGRGQLALMTAQETSRRKEEKKRQKAIADFKKSPQYKETLAIMLSERKL
jgi:hypothetical protein